MELLLSEAQPLAPHRAKEGNPPSVMFLRHEKGYSREANLHRCEIVCLLSGKITISYERFSERGISPGTVLLLPPGLRCLIQIKKDTEFIVLRPQDTAYLCEGIRLEELPVRDEHTLRLPILPINYHLQSFLQNLQENLTTGLCIPDFFDIKVKEFFFLIRAYYTTDQLAGFFYPLYSRNASFALFILKNHRYVKTVQEFARLYNCSISYFDKHFRDAFGTSAYKWMLKRRGDSIHHQITTTRKSFKQIATDCGFGSQPQFTDFCKKHLGDSPGELRRKYEYKNILKEEI